MREVIKLIFCRPENRSDLDDDEDLVNENENTSSTLRANDKNSKDVEGRISKYWTNFHI